MTQGVWPRPLLYRRLAPWLADLGVARPVKAWVIGMEDDLSSITRTVAARAAQRSQPGGQMEMQLYATLLQDPGRKGQASSRAEEATHDGHWPELSVDLRLSEPAEQVDLAAVRSGKDAEGRWWRAWETVRPGGRLLLDRSPS
ncbi:MAG TPA: hypothetical protein VMO88_15730, partial [Acidimicrobiales bacterium]|nr:hypothetical protein [Acidimicrobiales bacterium]